MASRLFYMVIMRSELKTSTALLLLLFVVLAVYYPTLFAPLNSVDDSTMQQYLYNTDDISLYSIFLPGGSASYYRPLVAVSFLADKVVWGLEASFMHLENIIIHLVNTLIIFLIAYRAAGFQKSHATLTALVTALFFAVHPLNSEAVNWISGRTDLLACFFLLLAILLLLRCELYWYWSFCSAICMLIACLAKETAIFFLPAALLFPFYVSSSTLGAKSLRETFRRYLLHLVMFGSAGCGYFLFRTFAFSQGDQGMSRVVTHVVGAESVGILTNLRIVLKVIGFYAKKLLIPFPLNFGITHISDWYLLFGLLVVAAMLWLVTRRDLATFFAICAGTIGSSALIIPLLRVTWTPVAERYMYIPSAFFLLWVSLTLRQWQGWAHYRTPYYLILASLLTIAVYGTASRNIIWQDNLTLFQDTFRKSPDFLPAQNEIANALHARGQTQEAAVIYKSFPLTADIANSQYGLANKAFALTREGSYGAAREVLRQALANPGRHEVMLLKRLLDVDKAEIMQKKATPRDLYAGTVQTLSRLYELTGDPFYRYRLGIAHLQTGERAKAVSEFKVVVLTAPTTAYFRKPAEKLAKELAK